MRERSKYEIWMISLAAFLSCMIPKFMTLMKVKIGINVSFYTLAVILIWLIFVRSFKPGKSYGAIFWCWLGWTVLSVWRAEEINRWAYYVMYLGIGLAWMIILHKENCERVYRAIEIGIAAAMAIHLAIGAYELLAHRFVFEVGNFNEKYWGKVAVSIFNNPNDYSTFVAVMLPFLFYLVVAVRKRAVKVLMGLLTLAGAVILYINESRLVVLSVPALIAVYLLALASRKKNKWIFWGPVMAACFAVSMLLIFDADQCARVAGKMIKYATGKADTGRINLLKNGAVFLWKTYGFGVGPGNLRKWLMERSIYDTFGLYYLHNWYGEILVTFGLPIFIMYIIFHVKILLAFYRRFRDGNSIFCENTAYLVSFVVFSFVCISPSTIVYSEWMWMYLIVCWMRTELITQKN